MPALSNPTAIPSANMLDLLGSDMIIPFGTLLAFASADSTNGNSFPHSRHSLLVALNDTGTAKTVTLYKSADPWFGREGVPSTWVFTLANLDVFLFGPFSYAGWAQSSGLFHAQANGAVKLCVLRLPALANPLPGVGRKGTPFRDPAICVHYTTKQMPPFEDPQPTDAAVKIAWQSSAVNDYDFPVVGGELLFTQGVTLSNNTEVLPAKDPFLNREGVYGTSTAVVGQIRCMGPLWRSAFDPGNGTIQCQQGTSTQNHAPTRLAPISSL